MATKYKNKSQGGHNWMYDTPLWQKRRLVQLSHHPLCGVCLQNGEVVAATVVHHVTPHNGVWEVFVSSELESLCERCHNGVKQSEEVLGFDKRVDINGKPLDPDRMRKRLEKFNRRTPGGMKS